MAGRPSYKITQQDYRYAARYLIRASVRGEIRISDGYHDTHDAASLQAWCENHLPEKIYEKMKLAIRAARKRDRDDRTLQRKVGVDLDRAAHIHLSSLAKELELSLSDTVLLLVETYRLAKKAGAV